MCIVIACFPACDVILVKPFLYFKKKSEQKFNYLKNENSL